MPSTSTDSGEDNRRRRRLRDPEEGVANASLDLSLSALPTVMTLLFAVTVLAQVATLVH